MPSSLDARQVTVHHGPRTVLRDVDLTVHPHSRTGLIGPNGSGKSTLLRVLAGLETPDSGRVTRTGTVGYLPQVAGEDDQTARHLIHHRTGVADANRALEREAARLASGDLDAIDAHAAALDRWMALGGDDLEPRIAIAADEVGLDGALLDRPLNRLSGGQAARVGLAAIRVSRHDVLLLDEPTNHLDHDGLALLRRILEHRGGIVLVSHDRAILDDTVEQLVVLGDPDQPPGTALNHTGDYAAWERRRNEQHRRAHAEHEQAVDVRDQLRAAEDETRRRASAAQRRASRGGRGLPDPDKHNREWVKSRADGVQHRAKVIAGRAAAVEIPDKPWELPTLRLQLTAAERRNGTAVRLDGIRVRRGGWTLGPLDLALTYGDRVLLTGRNGSGKSTLIGVLTGRIAPDDGEVTVAPGTVIAELGQARDRLAGYAPAGGEDAVRGRPRDRHDAQETARSRANGTTVDAVRALTGQDETEARTALAAFGLSAEVVQRSPATLSPGELTRAELAVLAATRTTCLVLDEPTNHLDIASLEAVEAALADWPGALVVASHDARFRGALAVNRTVELGR
ncbi:MAG: ABC-F family ATP-binding cassette domain-containing protein [Patulibacter sp.]|nr:ABC-F family ATP-binding cassette domain-containing protein [Patulibacter sp.]